jgi:two-component SAPR family response regulator
MNGLLIGPLTESTQNRLSRAVPVPGGAERSSKRPPGKEIADLLWPQADSLSKSLNRLYHTIHCLRMALSPDLKCSRTSPYVIGHDHHYHLLLPEGTWVDVPTFEQFCRRAEKLLKADQLEEALACYVSAERLYTGSLLSDIPVEYAENTTGIGVGAAVISSRRSTSRC